MAVTATSLGRAIAEMTKRKARLDSANIPAQAGTLAAWIECAGDFQGQLKAGKVFNQGDARSLLGGADIKEAVQVADALVISTNARLLASVKQAPAADFGPYIQLSVAAQRQLDTLAANPTHKMPDTMRCARR